MKLFDALWLVAFALLTWLLEQLADETTSHAPAPVHAIAVQHDEPELGPNARRGLLQVAMAEQRSNAWAAAARGALFTARVRTGRA